MLFTNMTDVDLAPVVAHSKQRSFLCVGRRMVAPGESTLLTLDAEKADAQAYVDLGLAAAGPLPAAYRNQKRNGG